MEYSTKLDTWYRPQPGRKFDGTFANGHTPYTKGKHLADFMTAEQIATFRAKGREAAAITFAKWYGHNAGCNRKAVIAIGAKGDRHFYPSIKEGAEATGANPRMIYKVLRGKGHHAGGYKWKLATNTQHPTPDTK